MRKIILCLAFLMGLTAYAQPKQEIRAVWLTTNHALDWPEKPVMSSSDITKQQEDLCRILDGLRDANFNVVLLQTRIRGNVIYPSEIEPRSNFIFRNESYSGYDPLEFAIHACHERGLECHAWFVTYPLGMEKVNGKPNNSPVVRKNKDLVRKFQGELYLDPGDPQTQTYLLSLVREIVSKYDIDGFHFDYIRYPDRCAKFPDQDNYKKYGYKQNIENWRRDNINRFVYAAYDTVKAIKPWVQVSSSVLGMYRKIPGHTQAHWTAYSSVFQDPVDWLKKGKHDFIVPMMYYSDDLFFPFVDEWKSNSYGRYVVPGLGLYRLDRHEGGWNVSVVLDQVRYSREAGTGGNAYYRTQHLVENRKDVLDSIKTGFYQHPAQLPPITWMHATLPGTPEKPDAVQFGDLLKISWNAADGAEKLYSLYCSESYPVDTENPGNLLAARLNKTEYTLSVDRSREKGYYFLVTASDRYHNESESSQVVFFYMGSLEK